MGVSAFLITLNEEKKIARALDSVSWTDERIVVDSGSSDRTLEICRSKGAKVFTRKFDNFENQKNYALSLTKQEWVLSIDADEIVTPSLAAEIQEVIRRDNAHSAYWIKRLNYFLGHPLHFGRQGKDQVLRLFQKNRGRFVGIVHEVVQINGSIGNLQGVLEHYGTETLTEYRTKLNLYTDLEAARIISERRVPSFLKALCFPPAQWILNYLFLGGFLDGRSGFFYHGLSCYYGWLKNFKTRALDQHKG